MSYILDALRKSEVEKTLGNGPQLLTATHTRTHPLNRWLVAAVVALLVVNLTALALWFLGTRAEDGHTSAGPAATLLPHAAHEALPASPAPEATVEPASLPPQPSIASPRSVSSADVHEGIVIAPPSGTSPALEEETIIGPDDLMAPAIEISTHVYSEDPSLRAVTIDGRRLREGDEIRRGVRLIEITESGIVVDADGVRSDMEVLQDWR